MKINAVTKRVDLVRNTVTYHALSIDSVGVVGKLWLGEVVAGQLGQQSGSSGVFKLNLESTAPIDYIKEWAIVTGFTMADDLDIREVD